MAGIITVVASKQLFFVGSLTKRIMANLVLTTKCNLRCEYCFANEFVGEQGDVMSYGSFLECLKFLSKNPCERIGLIGGEPTLHPDLKRMLSELIRSSFRSVCLFTNGILLNDYFNELRNSKFQILINVNEPEKVGQQNYERIVENIDCMLNSLYMQEQVGIGLNFYKQDLNYDYILDLLEKFKLKKIRISVSIPNTLSGRMVNPMEYFSTIWKSVRVFLQRILHMDVAPMFDCNYIPKCLISEDDMALFTRYEKTMRRSNLLISNPICLPTLDILPSLKVVRCFGMSDFYKVDLLKFRDTESIKRHFMAEVDALAYQTVADERCLKCCEHISLNCSCGCYSYKISQMKKLRSKLKKYCEGIL